MKKTFTSTKPFILSIICCLALAFGAAAQQTKKISLQGFLKDANGKAVADGQQSITFKLYTSSTGGTAEWTDTQTINVFGGVYSTHLGSTTNPLDNLNWGASTYYVGVTVQGTELTPRTELTFAPYSLGSPKAQEVVCSGAVGDIKHSILDPAQFAAVNGNCWVPMDGRALLATDKLRQITGMTTLPNGGGLFIRSQEFSNSANFDDDRTPSSPIASFQGESFKSHNHTGSTSSDGNHSHVLSFRFNNGDVKVNSMEGWVPNAYDLGRRIGNVKIAAEDRTGTNITPYKDVDTDGAGSHSHSLNINNNGGNETRPDNLNFWVYIRIN